jgi:two-component system, OmpR family, sensor kinase
LSWPTPSTLVRTLVPLLAGAALGGVLQLTESRIRLYVTMSPGLLAGMAGLAGTVILAVATGVRQRMAAVAASALRDAAVEATRGRLRFLARLDHELKNPLTAIRIGLANIEQAAPDETRATLTSVSAQTDRITRLVSDLRKLADLETQEIEMAPVDLTSLLHEVTETIAEIPDGGKRDIRVNVPQAPWPLPLIDGDRDLLLVAVQNLAANSVKFSAPGDTVEIRASEDGDAVLVEVADTGAGIPSDEIEQVWQELARGRAARSIPGTGIGLALVRVIVTRHGGRVAIRSRKGQGTVVSLWLPLPGRASTAHDVAILRHHGDTPGKTAL